MNREDATTHRAVVVDPVSAARADTLSDGGGVAPAPVAYHRAIARISPSCRPTPRHQHGNWLKTLISGTPDELAACLFGTWSAGERVN